MCVAGGEGKRWLEYRVETGESMLTAGKIFLVPVWAVKRHLNIKAHVSLLDKWPHLVQRKYNVRLRRFLNIFIYFQAWVYLGIGKQPHQVFEFVTVLLLEYHLIVPAQRESEVLESRGGRIPEPVRNGCSCLGFVLWSSRETEIWMFTLGIWRGTNFPASITPCHPQVRLSLLGEMSRQATWGQEIKGSGVRAWGSLSCHLLM